MRFLPSLKIGNLFKLALLFSLGIAGIVVFTPGRSYAAAFASTTFPNPDASTDYPLYMTIGQGEFDGSKAVSLIIADGPGTVNITVEEGQWCNDNASYPGYGRALDLPKSGSYSAPYFETVFQVVQYDLVTKNPGATLAGPTYTGFKAVCNDRNVNMSFNFPPGCSSNSVGKCVAVFDASVGDINLAYGGAVPGAAENSFRITVGGANNPKATFLPSKANTYPSFFNMSNRNRPNDSVANYNIDFTLPCSITSSRDVSMQFADVDDAAVVGDTSSAYQSSTNFPMTMGYALSPGGPSGNIISGNGLSGSGLTPVFTATLQPLTNYAFEIGGLSYINAITYSINVPDDVITAPNVCGSTGTCTIDSVVDLNTGGPVYAGSPVKFNVNTNNVPSGRQLGVNGSSYSEGNYTNYYVNGNQFARGSPVGVGQVTSAGKEGTLPTTGTTTIDDMMIGTSGDGGITQIIAPAPGTYTFNWGLINPNVGWTPVTICQGTLVVIPGPPVTISGRVYNAYNTGVNYGNVTINTCVAGVSATTAADGTYSFTIDSGTAFCINTNDRPNSAKAVNARPTGGAGYGGCAEFTADRFPNYCANTDYTGQTAGQSAGGSDRTVDGGYDLVFRYAPQMSCSVTVALGIEAGVPNNYQPKFEVTDTGTSTEAPLFTTDAKIDVTGVGTMTGTVKYGATRGNPQEVPLTPATLTIANPNTYTATNTATGTGDGFDIGPVDCSGNSSVTASLYPYIKSFGADVWAGGSYGATCSTTSGGIFAKATQNGVNSSGSSGQLGVAALLNINGYYSASLKTSGNTTPIKGSSFSNTNGDGTYGGALGGTAMCFPDYYTKTQATGITVKGDADFPPPSTTIKGKPKQDAVYTTVTKPRFRWTYVGGTTTVTTGPKGETITTYAPPASQTTDGYTNCQRIVNYLDGHPNWGDNWLCSLDYFEFSPEPPKILTQSSYVNINEPSDPAWNGTYIGTNIAGMTWSWNGNPFPAEPDRCVQIIEPSDPAWANGDNYLCVPPQSTQVLVTPEIPATPDQTVAGKFDAGKTRYMLNGPRTISGLNVPIGSQIALYVNGDVYINGNIIYDSPATTRADLPYLAIIATGNIYIDPGVDRIDGLLIAQPKNLSASPITDGRIYTCAPNGVKPADTNIYSLCSGKQLVVNGALIAQQVKFGRTFKSLKDSTVLEAPAFGTGVGTNAAELINFSPEMFLAPSPLKDPYSETTGSGLNSKYNAVFTLPPVF